MSVNLCFDVKGGAGMVDFPFQTSTDLTYAVLEKETNEDRLLVLEEFMHEMGWPIEDINEHLEEIKRLMDNPNLELTLI